MSQLKVNTNAVGVREASRSPRGRLGVPGFSPVPKSDDEIVHEFETELEALQSRFDSGKMRAFGHKEESLLESIEKIRAEQLEIFVEYMNLESKSKFKDIDIDLFNDDYENFKEHRYEDVTASFQEKQTFVDELSGRLHKVSQDINSINRQTHAALREDQHQHGHSTRTAREHESSGSGPGMPSMSAQQSDSGANQQQPQQSQSSQPRHGPGPMRRERTVTNSMINTTHVL
eukprot:GFYU01007398.1.p1 GENE.GFYU01007398.1~~GFYU01007398.1.p1  ORF type:complete len:243 (+),score=49.46 GFYU01007398.1:37-729(+)